MEAAAVAAATLAGDTLDPVAWEEVLKHNPSNHLALSKLADIARMQGRHLEAAGHLERLLAVGMPPSDCAGASSEPAGLGGPRSQGEVHAALGHCFLAVSHQESELSGILRRMQESHDAYKLALAQMMQGEDPDLWYGIGLLYDRYASLMKPCAQKSECEAAASKAFDAVLIIEPRHERRDEVPPRPLPSPSPSALTFAFALSFTPAPAPTTDPSSAPTPTPAPALRPPGALQTGFAPQGAERAHEGARVLHSHQREPLPPRRRSRRLVPGRYPPPHPHPHLHPHGHLPVPGPPHLLIAPPHRTSSAATHAVPPPSLPCSPSLPRSLRSAAPCRLLALASLLHPLPLLLTPSSSATDRPRARVRRPSIAAASAASLRALPPPLRRGRPPCQARPSAASARLAVPQLGRQRRRASDAAAAAGCGG